MRKSLLTVLIFAGVAAAAPAHRDPNQTILDPAFQVSLPRTWTTAQDEGGVRLTGPADRHGLSCFITIRRISPGDPTFADADAYVARLTKPPEFKIPGWKTSAVSQIVVAGRKARRFTKETTEYVPPSSMNTKEVPMLEEHVVVPASKGFYVLLYAAPRSIAGANRSVFDGVLSRFKPKD